MNKQEVNMLIDDLISIKDSHWYELESYEINSINKACNCLEVIANEQKQNRVDSYTLNYYDGVGAVTDSIDIAIKCDLIIQSGAWFKLTLKDGTEKKLQGRFGLQPRSLLLNIVERDATVDVVATL